MKESDYHYAVRAVQHEEDTIALAATEGISVFTTEPIFFFRKRSCSVKYEKTTIHCNDKADVYRTICIILFQKLGRLPNFPKVT